MRLLAIPVYQFSFFVKNGTVADIKNYVYLGSSVQAFPTDVIGSGILVHLRSLSISEE